jgi:hypothetical protein
MRLKEYNELEKTITNQKMGGSIVPTLLLLLMELKDLLFFNGKYKKLKWHQFGRIWKIAKSAIRLVNTLLTVNNRDNKGEKDWNEFK